MIPTFDTYIIADTHFCHKNIIKYCNRPEDHDFLMHYNWETTVKPEDDILHLGDVMWYKNDFALSIVESLPGRKYLIKGNHDKKNNDFWNAIGFTVMPKRIFMKYNNKTVLFTHYPENRFDIYWDINIHGHIHNNSYTKKEENGRLFINVSVEVMNYAPVKLGDILKGVVL